MNTAKVNYEPVFLRLDKDLFNSGLKDEQWLTNINSKYKDFSSIYFEEIMRIGNPANSMTAPLAERFTSDVIWRELQNTIEAEYPNMDTETQVMAEALKKYSVHFNETNIPELVAYNSGYNVGVYPSNEWLGVGLEWYCGTDHKVIDQLPADLFPEYKVQKMQRQYLVPNALKGFLYFKFQDQLANTNVLDRIVYAGKIHFLTDVLLSSVEPTTILNYSQAEYDWCEDNSILIWEYFLTNDLFYNEDPMQINKLVGDGPFTPGMPVESPGGVGNWVGYRMIAEFMDSNPDVSLEDLMNMKNNQVFLEYYNLK